MYFVVLAVLGATVAMMRRLPEYQHRASVGYLEEYRLLVEHDVNAPRPMSSGTARDYVIFQMLQVSAAPVIGVIAFAWAEPGKLPATTALAFAAGFSSETVLLAIRALAERLTGRDIPTTPSRDVAHAPGDGANRSNDSSAPSSGVGPGA